MLAQKTGLPVYELKEAKKALATGVDIIYLGWIRAGALIGYKKAVKSWHVKAVCAVGMRVPSSNQLPDIIKKNHLESAQAFYLQGGFDRKKHHGIYKFIVIMMTKRGIPALEKKVDKTDNDLTALDMLKNGGDCVREGNLDPVLAWLNSK